MHAHSRFTRFLTAVLATALLSTMLVAQPNPAAAPAKPAPPAPAATTGGSAFSDRDVASTQSQLIKLLRLSPMLTTVVARDPSLLANLEYVGRTNPQLGGFLAAHPEVVRNPDFYLFTHLSHEEGERDEALERAVWPEYHVANNRNGFDELLSNLPPVLVSIAFLVAFGWVMRMILENRRWSRTFVLQSEVHGKLIDKFSASQDLAAYMETEAGKLFLEASPIPLTIGAQQRVPSAVARILTPLQIGIVMLLLGAGFLLLRHAAPDMEIPMLVLGVVTLMPGAGFIISAGITWFLAGRLGLMPAPGAASDFTTSFGSNERQ